MSGMVSTGFQSEFYTLSLAGGISSWDYGQINDDSNILESALINEKSSIDKIVKEKMNFLNLNVSEYDLGNLPTYIDGVLIEDDELKEQLNKDHFFEYYDSSKSKTATANISKFIENTGFEIMISVLVTERVKRSDMEQLVNSVIHYISQSNNLNKILY